MGVGITDIVFTTIEIGAQGTDNGRGSSDKEQPDDEHQQDKDSQFYPGAAGSEPYCCPVDESPDSA